MAYPTTIANEIVSVQLMQESEGIIYRIKPSYGKNNNETTMGPMVEPEE